ncbi:MAG: hypothetical protein KME26_09450 [Oscillatoria princeps RMCB-10]|nr:hypothetical protein [Oscillatoria princeps RMCB-10]
MFFPLRYAKNCPLTVQHKKIAEWMKKDPRLGDGKYAASIGTTSQNVLRAIVNKYEEEMTKDGVDVNILLNEQKGQGGTEQEEQGGTEQGEQGGTKSKGRKKGQGVIWRLAYEWLWKHKYPRWLEANRQWLEANSWELLREKAKSPANWIQFKTNEEAAQLGVDRGPILPPAPPAVQKHPATIPANQSLWMVIDLKFDKSAVLLLNRSQDGECLLCPSSAYAPNAIMEEPPLLLPQKDSWAALDEEKTNFKFDKLGKEEFLAIVLKQPLNLPWLTPREDEELIEWNCERIMDLFDHLEHLEQPGEWPVFYQSFEVVELKPADG